MEKMPRIRQIAKEVKSGAITFAKGYNKVLNAIRRVDYFDIYVYIHAYNSLCS